MKFIIHCLFFSCFATTLQAQPEDKVLHPDILDQLSIIVTFEKTIYSGKCGCGYSKKIYKKCILYKGVVDSIVFIQDSFYYDSIRIRLDRAPFFVLPERDDSIMLDKKYIIFSSLSYYDYFNISTYRPYDHQSIAPNYFGSITGCSPCKKFTIWQELQFKLGINRDKVFEKGRPIPKEDDKYWKIIHNYLESNTNQDSG